VIRSLGGGARTHAQTLALTATATPYVRADIVEQLALQQPQTFVSGFDRPNLIIDVVHTEREREKVARIKRLAKQHAGSGIVYASTRKAVEQVSTELREQGLSVSAYHAGMGDAVRVKAQEEFMAGRTQIIVATNAFGMGIDKPDIRFVAHYQMPGSIEAYYQEIGRAGRDGLPSSCVLLFNYADKNTHDFFIEGSYPTAELIREVYRALAATGLKRIELTTSEIASRTGTNNEMAVNSCLYLLERAGHIDRVAAGNDPTQPPPWSRNERGAAIGAGKGTVAANTGRERGGRRSRSILMLDPQPATKLNVKQNEVAGRAALERRKLREMIEFCYTEYCYRAHILDYFGDRHHARHCGGCGNCTPNAPARAPLSGDEILINAPRQRARKGEGVAVALSPARDLTEQERLCVRKILACATRMRGRFGKSMLAAVLRGSAAKNVLQAHLHELSTYGLLKELRQDDVAFYIDALIGAQCLRVSPGAYPTVSITELGERVMREQEQVRLALPTIAP
jgi:ATP-dependent DNA helicase RecQ